ncbi:MAG: ribokinase [Thermoleophilaceae bacterium]|nr:ribokinase [Thermoleophilaceae bacterium]
MRPAVVGHVEWVEFARVERVPAQGEIVTAQSDFAEAAGGGGVAAVQLARLAGECTLYTALGDDETGTRARERLEQLGVRVEAAVRTGEPTRRAFTFLDSMGERTITVIGERLEARRADPLPWHELASTDAVYFTAGDPDALRAARAARVLVATARVMDVLELAAVPLDAVVASSADPSERYRPMEPEPALIAETAGAGGGAWNAREGHTGKWAAATVPGPVRDAYGCGDSFAAGLTYALGEGLDPDRALQLAAACGAACLAGDGPYGYELRRPAVAP